MKHQITLELNAHRRQELYNKLHHSLQEHHAGKPSSETPALLYEGLDALALVLAGLWVGVERGVGQDAAKTSKRYFKDRCDAYVTHLSAMPKEGIIYKQ